MHTYRMSKCGTSGVSDKEELEALILKKRALHDEDIDETLLNTPYTRVAQTVHPSNAEGIEGVLRNFMSYMEDLISIDQKYEAVKKTCKNRHYDGTLLAYLGAFYECRTCRLLADWQKNIYWQQNGWDICAEM